MNSSGITLTSASGSVVTKAPTIALDGTAAIGGPVGSGVPAAMLGTIDTGGFADVSNLATKVTVT